MLTSKQWRCECVRVRVRGVRKCVCFHMYTIHRCNTLTRVSVMCTVHSTRSGCFFLLLSILLSALSLTLSTLYRSVWLVFSCTTNKSLFSSMKFAHKWQTAPKQCSKQIFAHLLLFHAFICLHLQMEKCITKIKVRLSLEIFILLNKILLNSQFYQWISMLAIQRKCQMCWYSNNNKKLIAKT